MIGWRRPGFSLSQQDRLFRDSIDRILRYFTAAQVLSFVAHVQGTVEPFFHRDFLGPGRLFDLVELAVMGDGEIVLDRPLFFDAENAVEFSAGGGPVDADRHPKQPVS